LAAAVQFRDVSYRTAAGRTLVRDLTLDVREGEILALLGHSGSGKTTTLKLCNALLLPSSGEVRVGDVSTTSWDPIALRRRTGYVIQEVGLLPHLDVAANVGLVPTLCGWPEPKVRARVEEMLALVGLPAEDYAARMPKELSGGQRQRVGVARALCADPPLLLMDEPFGALDPITRAGLQREFRELQRRLEKTVVLVTHDVREALLLGDHIALLRDGTLVFAGTPAELRDWDDAEAAALRAAVESPWTRS
jgi:osmoprotectant transport system ATP-binding protein